MARRAGAGSSAGHDLGPSPAGHNKLTEEEWDALFLNHLDKLDRQDRTCDEIKGALKAANKVRNQLRAIAKSEVAPLHLFDEVLKRQKMTGAKQTELQNEENLRRRMFDVAGLPVAVQGDLFAKIAEPAHDEIAAESDGYICGRRALERKPPAWVAPRHHQTWLANYDRGQDRTQWAFAEAGKIVDRNTNIAGQHVPLTDETSDEGEGEQPDPLSPEEIEKQAAALSGTDFVQGAKPAAPQVDLTKAPRKRDAAKVN